MKKNTIGVLAEASAKTPLSAAKLELPLPVLEVLIETRAEIKADLRRWGPTPLDRSRKSNS